MKKRFLFNFGILLLMFSFKDVSAASTIISVSKSNVYVGDTFNVYAKMSGAAAWNIHVTPSGPVSGCVINVADSTSDAKNINKTFSATCKATGTGRINLNLSGDITSDDGNNFPISGSSYVNVTNRPVRPTINKPVYVDNRSKDNSLKSLSVEGYELVKVDNNNYKLEVSNLISKIKIIGSATDNKAKIQGVGEKNLKIGDNNFLIIVTSESGLQNKINVKIKRKEGYYLDDINNILSSDSNTIDILLKENDILSKEILDKIKKSKKIINFNFLNEKKELIYSFIVDGSKLDKVHDINLNVSNISENIKEIEKLSNYASGINYTFSDNKFFQGMSFKVKVSDRYENKSLVNIYCYDKSKNNLFLVNKDIQVNNGYVIFDLFKCNGFDYFITMSNICNECKTNSCLNWFYVIFFLTLSFIIIILILIYLLFKFKCSNKNKNVENSISTNDSNLNNGNNIKSDSTLNNVKNDSNSEII